MWDEEAGWIVTGAHNCPDLGDCRHDPAIWTSPDGRTWTRGEVPQQEFTVVTAIARGADAFFAAGYHCAGRTTGLFYRSEDARHWERIGSLDLGRVQDDECNPVQHLGATDAGLVATLTFDVNDSPVVFRSSDGEDWTPVSDATFGLPPKSPVYRADMVQVDPSTVILAAACASCPIAVWRSSDGSDWTEVGRIGDVDDVIVYAMSATTGPRLVVAAVPCYDCDVRVWALDADGSFHEAGETALPHDPHLAFVNDTYLLVGTAGRPGGAGAFASADGLVWTPLSTEPEMCAAADLVAGPTQALLLTNATDFPGDGTDGDCAGGIWLVDVTPG
jgi:hypothetical protein